MQKKNTSYLLTESKADLMRRLAEREDIMDQYAKMMTRQTFVRGRNGEMKSQSPNDTVMNELAYDCQQKYGFCERPAAMKALVRDYLMPVIQKMAKEKYGYNGPIWPSKAEQKATMSSKFDANEQKLQDAGAAEKLMNDENTLYWTGFSFIGRKGIIPSALAREKRETIEKILRDLGVYMSPNDFLKTATGKKFIKAAKKFYETHSYDFQTKTFVPKELQESRRIKITEADMRWMISAIKKKSTR